MRARIIGLATAVSLVAPAVLGHGATASAATAQFYVTGYVLQGYTATGTWVHPGTCAVDPRIIPLGTYFTISGIGTCHAEDTGGAIVGYRIDVWVPTVAQAYALTGWYTVTWGAAPSQQVLGYHASQSTHPPVATSRPVPKRPVYRPQGWYSHPNAYLHRDAGDEGVPGTSTGYTSNTSAQPYTLISLHGKGCRTTTWTTRSAGRRNHHWATTCT